MWDEWTQNGELSSHYGYEYTGSMHGVTKLDNTALHVLCIWKNNFIKTLDENWKPFSPRSLFSNCFAPVALRKKMKQSKTITVGKSSVKLTGVSVFCSLQNAECRWEYALYVFKCQRECVYKIVILKHNTELCDVFQWPAIKLLKFEPAEITKHIACASHFLGRTLTFLLLNWMRAAYHSLNVWK